MRVAIIEPGVIQTAIFENSAAPPATTRARPIARSCAATASSSPPAPQPGPAQTVAEIIWEAVTTDRPRLRYLVGTDAEGLAAGRGRISDEEWVAMGAGLDDAEYNARFKRYLGSS